EQIVRVVDVRVDEDLAEAGDTGELADWTNGDPRRVHVEQEYAEVPPLRRAQRRAREAVQAIAPRRQRRPDFRALDVPAGNGARCRRLAICHVGAALRLREALAPRLGPIEDSGQESPLLYLVAPTNDGRAGQQVAEHVVDVGRIEVGEDFVVEDHLDWRETI